MHNWVKGLNLGDERGVGIGVLRGLRHARLRRFGGHPRRRTARRAHRRRRPPLLQLAGAVLLLQSQTLIHSILIQFNFSEIIS